MKSVVLALRVLTTLCLGTALILYLPLLVYTTGSIAVEVLPMIGLLASMVILWIKKKKTVCLAWILAVVAGAGYLFVGFVLKGYAFPIMSGLITPFYEFVWWIMCSYVRPLFEPLYLLGIITLTITLVLSACLTRRCPTP